MNIEHIIEDFIKANRELQNIGDSITIFGSSRLKEDSFYYQKAQELGRRLSDMGYNIITGGSSGIMEASNRGAKISSKSQSIGLHMMNLPNEERPNLYLDKKLEFHHFCSRKFFLTNHSKAYIIMAGGFGTLDEFFEILNLVRTKNHPVVPIILFGSDYWSGLYEFMSSTMLEYKTINQNDLELITLTDSIDEVIDTIG